MPIRPAWPDTTATGGRLDAGAALTCSGTTQLAIDAPGQGFVAVEGRPLAVRLLAGVCGNAAGVTVTASANGQPIALTARGDGLFTGSYTPSGPGAVTISATASAAGGSDSAGVAGTVPPTIVAGGAPITVTSAAGENAVAVFDGVAGHRASLQLISATIPSSTVTVRAPDGSALGMAYVGPSGAFIDTFTLTQTGTYQVVVDPVDRHRRQHDHAAVRCASRRLGGDRGRGRRRHPDHHRARPERRCHVHGHRRAAASRWPPRARYRCSRPSILRPDGTTLAGPLITGSSSGWIDTVRLPLDGTYTILADPGDGRTGSVTLTLYDVPADVTAPITAGGADVTVTVTAPDRMRWPRSAASPARASACR